MAKQNTTFGSTNRFDKNLQEDIKDYHLEDNSWTQARNAITNSKTGDIGSLGNEPANLLCVQAPYTITGRIHMYGDTWAIYSTDDTNSEIGIFDVSQCSYTKLVNDPCLGFKRTNLIRGIAKENFDCTWQLYWADDLNPDRTLNTSNVPYIQICTDSNGTGAGGCITCVDTDQLDCSKLLLSPLKDQICLKVSRDVSGGTLPNGSYYAVAAYTINGQVFGDYSIPSNIQSLFTHENVSSSLKIEVSNIDTDFEEFELVLISIVNQQTVARRIGLYSTNQKVITVDIIDNRYPIVPIQNIPIRTPVYDKSEGIYRNGDFALRIAPTEKFDFNYQPLANQITSKWVAVEYDQKYYFKGGSNTGYMRDEVYSFFIRWIWETGDKTASFHIPGRAPGNFSVPGFGVLPENGPAPAGDSNVFETDSPKLFETYNTAPQPSPLNIFLPDGGKIISEGRMAYHESTEFYDNNSPEIWNANVPGHPEWDLCGKPIRHHKFPDNATDLTANQLTNHFAPGGEQIRIMGVKFLNIQPPVDNLGQPISGLVGYEILRGTREGNRTVIAKGMINNMFKYDLDGDPNTNSFGNRTGLYPNFPYNDLGPDPYVSTIDTITVNPGRVRNFPNRDFSQQHFTFHSPETSFNNPFLSPRELKIYGSVFGQVNGSFHFPEKHPKHKFITNAGFVTAVMGAVAIAILAKRGKRTLNLNYPQSPLGVVPANLATYAYTLAQLNPVTQGIQNIGEFVAAIGTGQGIIDFNNLVSTAPLNAVPGVSSISFSVNSEEGLNDLLPAPLNIIQGLPTFLYFFSEGLDTILRVMRAVGPFRRHALQYQSHCKYTNFVPPQNNNRRFLINDSIYLDPEIQDYNSSFRINNLYRGRTVALDTVRNINNVAVNFDDSKFVIADKNNNDLYKNPQVNLTSRAHSHYVGLKQRLRNQYGQLEGIIQVPVSTCYTPISMNQTGVLFNGDTYVGRFTEKNTMFFFYDWLFNQPDGAFMDYSQKKMIPHPTYWMNTDDYDLSDFVEGVGNLVSNPAQFIAGLNGILPNSQFRFDERSGIAGVLGSGLFQKRNCYMYLFNSGVRDFFVESEINIDLRDYGDNDSEKHYTPYGPNQAVTDLFDMGVIRSGNFYKYDFSLSISRLFNNFFSWGNTQDRTYDPQVAEECYTKRKNRVIYSLPQSLENKKDYWKVFLPNNYKDFKSRVTSIKSVGKNGAILFFENDSPIQFLGVDQLETDSGTKITLGDGGLFSQPLQNLFNTEEPYEYGSCQDELSIINTPGGLYWMSQNQGKIFRMEGGSAKEISAVDLRWWFNQFAPYRLLEDFPSFSLIENPVIGIGCQSIYDNENSVVYFCKKDYKLKPSQKGKLTYLGDNRFSIKGFEAVIELGDKRFFDNASWTISMDTKTGQWIGYHDWHPDLCLPGKNTFLTSKLNGLWVHNQRTDLYCNYYGDNYPFEIEFTTTEPMRIGTLRNVEYYMEAYVYKSNEYDRFHILDFNFDEAVIYNTEQCSGILKLNNSPKNNISEFLKYPIINSGSIDILYSKEENKYRFNQFWDITADRGEYNSAAQRSIWNTEENGYIRNLNSFNLNYNKNSFERKKFRHYVTNILMRRKVCGSTKMLVSLTSTKNLMSPR